MSRRFWSVPSALDVTAREIGLQLTPEHRAQLAQEQARMVLLHTRLGTLAATGFALMLAWYLHGKLAPGAPQDWLVVWVVAKLLVAAARMLQAWWWMRRAPTAGQDFAWQRGMLALLALDGLVWGLGGWAMMGQPVPLAALVVAVIDGVSCAATFGLQVRVAATAAYVLPMLLPLALGLAQRDDDIAHFTALGELILAALLVATARATSRQLATGWLLRLRADALAAEKEAALRLAHEQSAERKRFLAKVSHELRTPLHGMLGLTRLLHLEASNPTLAHRLELIESSGTQLLVLINDLLEVSRIEAGHFVLKAEPFDLTALLQQQAEVFALRAADKGLHFRFDSALARPWWVRGDAARLRQVLNNLLGNAVKFTHRGQVALHVTPAARAGWVRMVVSDTGPGIGADELTRIFQPFHQVAPRAPAGAAGQAAVTDGVGLGLTIAREIALALGSDISVRSAPGRGSTFRFEAHLPAVPPPPAPDRTVAPARSLPRLVLVAEDDEVNALIVGAYLDAMGVRHERVGDGQQAVSRALRENDRPEVVLMDWRMPLMDGLAATADIRRQERALGLRRLPIIALTATASEADRQACLDAGMDELIAKPFTPEQLADALQRAVRTPAR